jgi:hypothetical protein
LRWSQRKCLRLSLRLLKARFLADIFLAFVALGGP